MAAAGVCGCGVRHRSEAAAAKCGQGVSGPRVEVDDVLGVLSLMDGRLVATPSGVLAVSPSMWQSPALPGQVATQREVFAVMAGLVDDPGALAERLNRFLRTGLPVSAAVSAELAEQTAAALTGWLPARLKVAA